MVKKQWVPVILALAILAGSCQLFTPSSDKGGGVTPTSSAEGMVSGDPKRVFAEQPTFDLAAPPPSPGAAALRILAGWAPGVAEVQGDVEAAERAALNGLIKEVPAQTGSSLEFPFSTRRAPAAPAPGSLIPVSYRSAANQQDGTIDTAHDVSLLAGMVTGLADIISENMPPGSNVRPTETTTEGSATTTMTGEVGKSTDGSSKFGLGMQTETVKNGVTTKTDFEASVDGQRCPNAEGQVSFTVKVRLGAESGGNGFTQDLTAFVRSVVDDNAEIATTTTDVLQSTQQVKDGRMVYIESGHTLKYNGDDMTSAKVSNLRITQQTQNITQAEAFELTGKGHDAALTMARTALLIARDNWRGGGCVKIEAASPGKVQAGSTTPIAVTVLHKFDGSTVPAKLEAVLAGETSLVPLSLPKTPGTVTYTAPGENGKSATIKLTATSRRGMATLDLTANTGGESFTFAGANNGANFSGTICSPDKPFEMTVSADGETWTQTFTPNSNNGGQMEGSYTAAGCSFTGAGLYSISVNEDGSGTLKWTNNWTADCPGLGSKSGVVEHQLPLQPAPVSACP